MKAIVSRIWSGEEGGGETSSVNFGCFFGAFRRKHGHINGLPLPRAGVGVVVLETLGVVPCISLCSLIL